MEVNYNRNLHRFTVITAVCTFCLVIAGGLVTSTGSGLAVPDWPLSYGKLMPPMVGGILYEHSHRMVATFVGMLAILLAVWLWKNERRRWLRILGLVALGTVITQGLLGGLTVHLLLPTSISVGHAALAQTFFCIIVSIAFFTSRWWIDDYRLIGPGDDGHPLLSLCLVTTLVVYVQLILGAVMRHTHSGLAVPDFPLSYGQLIPSLSPESIASYNEQLMRSDLRLAADPSITWTQIVIHMMHRFWAVVVGVMVIWTAIKLHKLSILSKRFAFFSYVQIGLLIVQISLGAWSVISRKSVEVTTAHVATGALLLGSCVLVLLHVVRLRGMTVPKFSFSLVEKEAIV